MPVFISLLRAVNVGGRNRIKMDALRDFYGALKLRDAVTYVQSGNVVFRTEESNLARLARRIEEGIEREFGFHADVMLRTFSEWKAVIARNPFAKRRGLEPAKLLVFFLAGDPGPEARERVLQIEPAGSEEPRLDGQELYVYFPEGMGRSRLPPRIEKALKMPATARNWNSIIQLLQIAERLDSLRS